MVNDRDENAEEMRLDEAHRAQAEAGELPTEYFDYRCPKCRSLRLAVVILAWAQLDQDPNGMNDGSVQGTEVYGDDCPDGDHTWSENSMMNCKACGTRGPAAYFSTRGQEPTFILVCAAAESTPFGPHVSSSVWTAPRLVRIRARDASVAVDRVKAYVTAMSLGRKMSEQFVAFLEGPEGFIPPVGRNLITDFSALESQRIEIVNAISSFKGAFDSLEDAKKELLEFPGDDLTRFSVEVFCENYPEDVKAIAQLIVSVEEGLRGIEVAQMGTALLSEDEVAIIRAECHPLLGPCPVGAILGLNFGNTEKIINTLLGYLDPRPPTEEAT